MFYDELNLLEETISHFQKALKKHRGNLLPSQR